jgi:hypothetical protein
MGVAAADIRAGRYGAALALYEAVTRDRPDWPGGPLQAGHVHKIEGRIETAIGCYREAIARVPAFGPAWWSLANLKTYAFDWTEVEAMERAAARPELPRAWTAALEFALGSAYEARREWQASAAHYARGNALTAERVPFNEAAHTQWIERQVAHWTAPRGWAVAESRRDTGREVIFIVGLPRAGSTLLEQMLGSHPEIEATIEHPNLWELGAALGSAYPAVVETWTEEDRDALGRRYLEAVRPHRRTGKPLFVDKLPDNYLYLPLIASVLPGARVIDMRRERRAAAFANWKMLFAGGGYGWTYRERALGRQIRDYERWMAHIDQVFPWLVSRVSYEALVSEPELMLMALCARLGVPWAPAMLDFTRLKRPMRTSSSEQVKRPLTSDAVEHWRHYEAHCPGLWEALS